MAVNERVVESHEPLFVKIGVRTWNTKRVPVGRSLARFAVLASVWESADGGCGRDVGCCIVVLSSMTVVAACVAVLSSTAVVAGGRALKDILFCCGKKLKLL